MINEIKPKLAEMIAAILEADPNAIDEDTHFGEYGLESVTMTEFAARINRDFGLNINPTFLYEHNTIASLGEALPQLNGLAITKPEPTGADIQAGMIPAADRDFRVRNLEEELIRLAAGIIGIPGEEFPVDAHFGELGYESITLGELAEKISGAYGLEITPVLLYEKNTIRELARYLYSQIADFPAHEAIKKVNSNGRKGRHQDQAAKPESAVSPPEPEGEAGIAIIGMAGVFPQSEDLDEFWTHLFRGECLVGPVPQDREELTKWRNGLKAADPSAPEPQGGFMKAVDKFDPLFFNISPKEAELMDPQQRMFLETVWSALEEAGYSKSALAGSNTGVFVGISSNDYTDIQINQGTAVNAFTATGKAYSILANRISYYFDWHGPSQAVDTACSSSLVALHYATESIYRGECELAVVGGVNILLSPAFFQSFTDAGMLSPAGRCRTFDQNADGYVRGEGIAALVLKPLSKAISDGNHIHGVIKASGVNHGGHAHSLTAPNPEAQADLLLKAYRKAGIDPGTVGYIEAHGTGTKLGDPIEIQAIKKAFGALYQDWGYLPADQKRCGIGSVKTNTGHLEAAAGMAGIIKVLLAMKHRTLPRTVNFTEINPYIEIEETPFYIVKQTENWERPKDRTGLETPRRAGVSSFGFGGTNAHIVLEEYPETGYIRSSGVDRWNNPRACSCMRSCTHTRARIIVLSARNKERLTESITKLTAFLEGAWRPDTKAGAAGEPDHIYHPATNSDLSENSLAVPETARDVGLEDLAFTLQTGREAMEERLALVVTSPEELMAALKSYLKGAGPACPYYHGNVPANKETLNIYFDTEEGWEHLRKLSENGKLDTLARLWVEGVAVDWERLYGDCRPQRISLPTYPFARERYWISGDGSSAKVSERNVPGTPVLHPLLHQNSSDLFAQRFSSTFTGMEFFLADHLVGGKRVLPGVAYLEMARAAFAMAGGGITENPSGFIFKNIVWPRLLIIEDKPVPVHIRLLPDDNDEIFFEIYSESKDEAGEIIIHGQGSIVRAPAHQFSGRVPALNIPQLKNECNEKQLSSDQCYQAIRSMGIDFGPGFRIIETIYQGKDELLARLALPSCLSNTQDIFFIHPGIVDGALQAQIGLLINHQDDVTSIGLTTLPTFVPFNLNELQIFQKPEPQMWAYLRYSDGNRPRAGIRTIDIDLCNDRGEISMQFKGLSFVKIDGNQELGSILLHPVWEAKPAVSKNEALDYSQHLVILCDMDMSNAETVRSRIESRMKDVGCLILNNNNESIDKRFTKYGIFILEAIQKIFREKPKGKTLIQIVIPGRKDQPLLAGFSGLLKTAGQEKPGFIGQVIEIQMEETIIDPGRFSDILIEKLDENTQHPEQDLIRYHGGKRWVRHWREWENPADEIIIPWKKDGVYLITGGAGGLGLIFAQEILRQARSTTLILAGRSALKPETEAKIAQLKAAGADIVYYQVDVTDRTQVNHLIGALKKSYGRIDGILHCAGVTHDNYIHKKTSEEFLMVMAPKVTGLVNLDEATRDLQLDFMLLFSSVASALGSPGQADYACANAFMDDYAIYRNRLVLSGNGSGKTISIHWPLWKEGGMRIPEANREMLWENTGIAPLETEEGIRRFYQVLASGREQCMVISGNLSKIWELVNQHWQSAVLEPISPAISGTQSPAGNRAIDSPLLLNKVKELLIQRIAKLLKLKPENINAETEFNNYGFNSITLTEFANGLNREFRLNLMPTIFFDRSTLDRFAEYLVEEYQASFQAHFKIDAPGKSAPDITTNRLETKITESTPVGKRYSTRFGKNGVAFSDHSGPVNPIPPTREIAIIGMSGQFPLADDLNQFWKNLVEGINCITEIPKARWDWRSYYGDPAKEAGKTNIKWGGFINGVDEFDPLFFGISPKEAELMDPQQRLLMIHVWKCIEDAGYSPQSLSGTKTGILVGTAHCGYTNLITKLNLPIEGYTATGIVPSVGPNRMSYLLNLHGPSEPIETACSSSLVAIHRAIELLRNGSCELAIAGGVNTMLTPDFHISFSKAGMLSEDGLCKTFSDQADGYVRGEGAGMLVLKPLAAAERDGDHIYGLILSSAENHGGRANSLTAPNSKAQAELLREAYRKTGIDPRTVTYIEAHGTGTKLGDPVEIEGLKTAFKDLFQDAGQAQPEEAYCGLGSVKTNIGHLELSAGIAGVIKVLLQIKHKTLVRSLHCETVNPYIQLDGSPFYIVRENKEWKALEDEYGEAIPRRGGVSSFGFGGVNAHVVIQEYIPRKTRNTGSETVNGRARRNQAIIVLSAKNEERLADQVRELLAAFEERGFTDNDLPDIAYTLQVGRETMAERLSLVVTSLEELTQALTAFIHHSEFRCPVFQCNIHKQKEKLNPFFDNQEGLEYIGKLYENRKMDTLARLWTEGISINWETFDKNNQFKRISLPTYPFAKEHYWLPAAGINGGDFGGINSGLTVLHPLVHQNTSDLAEQRFSSTFTGREFFLEDHIVTGQRVLPGITQLEMARAAVNLALDGSVNQGLEKAQTGMRLKNVVWDRPVVVKEHPTKIHIGLFPEENGEIAFEIYSTPQLDDSEMNSDPDTGIEPIAHSRGNAIPLRTEETPPALDLNIRQARCTQGILSSNQCYEAFQAMGIDYDADRRGIEKVYLGADQLLAKLSLPSAVLDTGDRFVLHPVLMDAVLQAIMCLMMNSGYHKPILPLSLQEIDIFSKCAPAMWALIRYGNGNTGMAQSPKFDIDLWNETGRICVSIKGLQMREETNPQIASPAKTQEPFEMMTFEEVWLEQALVTDSPARIKTMVCFISNPENQRSIAETLPTLECQTADPCNVIYISQGTSFTRHSQQKYDIARRDGNTYREAFRSIMADYGEVDAVLYLWPLEDSGCITDYSAIVHMLQAVDSAKLKSARILLAAQFKNGLERCYPESWIGFERSLGMVLPDVSVAVICREAIKQNPGKGAMNDWLRILYTELQARKVQSVLYQDGKRYVCRIRPTITPMGNNRLKSGGTYLITGGCGGLGFIFARYFAETQPVNLILTGRSPLDAEKQSKIKALEELGSQVLYVRADICDRTGMTKGLERAKRRFGRIDGVIHAAGIVSKQSILTKEFLSFQEVLEPKIKGTLVLDELLRKEPLDFICYFSSSAAVLGDFGSCDYAVGNRFQTAHAGYRDRQKQQGLCRGKTIAINWPLWKDGGMKIGNDENTELYLKFSGQRRLESREGLAIFERLLSQENAPLSATRHLVLIGQRSPVYRYLGLIQEQVSLPTTIEKSFPGDANAPARGRRLEMKGLSVAQCLEWDLKEHIGKLLKISREMLDKEENLAQFGFDSISLAQFANILTVYYSIELTPALFFSHSTLEKLMEYFLREHQAAIQAFYREDFTDTGQAISSASMSVDNSIPNAAIGSKRPRSGKSRFALNTAAHSVPPGILEPIAIIGMSGRFPGARNIDEMWKILAEGQDVIQEFPDDRLHHSSTGKTKWKCGCIPGVSEFDPLFFEISPREAQSMDPRQRLLLQESWRALEDAGYGANRIKTSKIGMFVGVEQGNYQLPATGEGSITSNHDGVLAARLAYFLNFSGPVMAINTACSSGLVAAHQACMSLRNGECDTAIAAGVNLLLTPKVFEMMSEAGMLSPDGTSYVFDKRANGMVPGEAVVAVVLKRLSQAKADGDPIYAVIKGSGVNYDGKTNGITAPSGVSQTNLLKTVYEQYQVNPEIIEYIVTHGTGTKLGDPVEINALYDAFKDYTKKQRYCALTSTKTNFGHTLATSGLVSLISLAQALRHETIPASLHCEQENDYINWKESPFYVNKMNQTWIDKDGESRTGAVSAFGMSGTNAHMVVQSYTYTAEEKNGFRGQVPYYLLALSAKTQEALQVKIKDMIEILQNRDITEQELARISYTLLEGRQHFEYRCAIVIQDREDAVYILQQVGGKEKLPNLFQGKVPRDFTGQTALHRYAEELLKQSQSLKENKHKYQEIFHALAELYCQGYEISWDLLFGALKPRRVHLPTYPFEKRRYWIEAQPESRLNIERPESLAGIPSFIETTHTSLANRVIDIVSDLLGITVTELNINKPLFQYGFDSILLISLFQQLQSQFNLALTLDALRDSRTTQDIINILPAQPEAKLMAPGRQGMIPIPEAEESIAEDFSKFPELFPELIHLNQISQGRPVFWFHAAIGGVEVYQGIAKRSGRPFYGIQARGWMNQRAPLHGIQTMAAYYIDVIRSAQPEGPYDLGGYSFGGVIAYEVARQLQASGQDVDTIVMLDTIYIKRTGKPESEDIIWKDAVLRIINMMLLSRNTSGRAPIEAADLSSKLIRRDELDLNSDQDTFLMQAINLAKEHGLNLTEAQLKNLIQQNAKVQTSYGVNDYTVLPLPGPDRVSCYYFRNKNGAFYGELEPYFSITPYDDSMDTQYWQEWENQIRDFRIIDLDSSSHLMLLAELQNAGTVSSFCEQLYGGGPKQKADLQETAISQRGIRKIAILAFGSRGDVQPLVALGKGLKKAGYAVTIAAVDEYQELIANNGLDFAALNLNAGELKVTLQDRHNRENKVATALSRVAKQNLARNISSWLDNSYEACRGCDLLLYTGLAYHHGIHVAEKLKVPSIPVYLQPITENSAVASFLMPELKIGARYNRLSYRMAEEFLWKSIGGSINRWRLNNGMKPLSGKEIIAMKHHSSSPVIYGFSALIFPKPAEWGDHISLAGYFLLEKYDDWQPTPKLARFLEAGPPPVYAGFGSMNDYLNQPTTKVILEALRQTGERIILAVGWENIKAEDLPENMFVAGYTPHHWLFPRMKAIIHQGGAGTTAAALQAGVPSIVIPFMLDQPFWGDRAYQLGVCPKPIPFRDLTVSRLKKALEIVLYDNQLREKAEQIGKMISNEDGVANAVARINQVIAEYTG
jgi:polyketide synthase PksN